MRRLFRIAAIIVVLVLGLAAADRVGYDPGPWLADLATLEDSLARNYANLDHRVAGGQVDPVALHHRTDSLLRHAGSRRAARRALADVAAAFADGHLSVQRPTPGVVRWIEDRARGRTDAPPALGTGADAACRALGYHEDFSPSLLELADGWTPLGEGHGGAGTLPIGGHTVGVLRIASFGVQRHLAACTRAWPGVAESATGPTCDGDCQDALWVATADTILADHRRTLAALAGAGAALLVVDLTGNGGGNEWVNAAARQVTARALRGHAAGAVRHPHHLAPLDADRAVLASARAASQDPAWNATLDSALARIARQEEALRAGCDRGAVWTRPGPPPCPVLATHGFTTGWADYLPPSRRGAPGAPALFAPFRFAYTEGAWSGPVAVLVDGRTASASEDFVAALGDHDAAVVVGERTYGAGCGMTNGGLGFRLPESGLVVRLPDCARIRHNGRNEVDGIEPDVAAGWESSDPEIERARKAVAAIRGVVSR